LDTENRVALGLENYQAAKAQMLYTPETNMDLGLLLVPKHYSPPSGKLLLIQIPNDFQNLRAVDLPLAKDWRFFTREVFEDVFSAGYIVTDFIYDRSESTPRSFYLLTDGESTIG
jgi:predicted GNAT superfamily acetyltransferase